MKTIAFERSIGVFEGGGVRGAAFAGAYEASFRAGIEFVGTVGTSVGAIAATMIAAGMTASQVRREIGKDFFRCLLGDPNPPEKVGDRMQLWLAKKILKEKWSTIAQMWIAEGLHSSESIETWLNSVLKKHLPKAGNIIRFRDLKKPTAVLAADMVSSGPKVYSTTNTPESSVAFAVRASCSIPYFFQPVRGEGCLLADGGILANLPVFLAKELNLDSDIPVLGFRLVSDSDESNGTVPSGEQIPWALINTIINGATNIQLNMGEARQIIDISTGSIKSTDFQISQDQIKKLIQNGKRAVEEFVNDEQIRILDTGLTSPKRSTSGFREGLLHDTAKLIQNSTGEIRIFAGDLTWTRQLYIDLVSARLQNQKLKILCEKGDTPKFEEDFQGCLSTGAQVLPLDFKIPFRGLLVLSESGATRMITIEREPAVHGRILEEPKDSGLIALINEYFVRHWDEESASQQHDPTITAVSNTELVTALKNGVSQYADCSITVEDVRVDTLLPLTCHLERFKLARVETLRRMMRELGLIYSGHVLGAPWLINPPVIEKLKNGKLIIIDGVHRVYDQRRSNLFGRINVIIVENNLPNLPAKPMDDWTTVSVRNQKKTRAERYEFFNEREFRPISEAFKALAAQRNLETSLTLK